MSELVHAYENPDGEMTAANAAGIGDELIDAVASAQAGAPLELSNDVVDTLGKVGGVDLEDQGADQATGDAGSTPDSTDTAAGTPTVVGNKIDVAASVKIHRICRGWNNRIDEDVNGWADFTVTFDRAGLIPTIWGELTHCRFKRGDTTVELNGHIQLHFGTTQARIGLRALKTVGYLVEFDGNVMALRDGVEIDSDISLNLRVFVKGVVQLNVNLADGTNVIAVVQAHELTPGVTPTTLSAGVITNGATWNCQFDVLTRTGECTNQTNPNAAVMRW